MMGRMVRGLGIAAAALAALLAVAFGLLQTPLAERPVAALVGRIAGYPATVEGLSGTIPFAMRVRRVRLRDARGIWLTLDDVVFRLSPRALFAGTADITRLTAAAAAMSRPPLGTAGPPETLSQRLAPPHLPLSVRIDRLAVGRIVLAPVILGRPVTATLAGNLALVRGAAQVNLDLHRTDGTPGSLAVALAVAGTPSTLSLKVAANEPTGVLLDRLLRRRDHLPLALSLRGRGRLADWRGRLVVTAGDRARLAADLTLAAGRDIVLTAAGEVAAAPLLPPRIIIAVGRRVPFALRATLLRGGGIAIDRLSVTLAAGTVSGHARFGAPDRKIAALVRASLPALASLTPPGGQRVAGAATIEAQISGTETQPVLALNASGSGLRLGEAGAVRASARLTVSPTGNLSDPASRVQVAAQGDLRDVALPGQFPAALGRTVAWRLAASVAADGRSADLTRLAVTGAGLDVTGAGHLAAGAMTGRLHLAVADLRPYTALLGHPVAGALALDARAAQPAGGEAKVRFDGRLTGLAAGVAGADALLGRTLSIAGMAQRSDAGLLVLDEMRLDGRGIAVEASGQYDPATQSLAAVLAATVPHLAPLDASLGTTVAGRLDLRVEAKGPLDRLRLAASLDGSRLAAGRVRLDHLHLDLSDADLAQTKAVIDGNFRSGGLDGSVAIVAARSPAGAIAIPRLHVAAAGGTLDGHLQIDAARREVEGALGGNVPDLARWSRLAGTRLAGALTLKAKLSAPKGQNLDLDFTGNRVAWGGLALGHVAAAAKLHDLFGMPSGSARVELTAARLGTAEVARLRTSLTGQGAGRFAFAADLEGRLQGRLALALSGEAREAGGAGGLEIRLARLAGTLGGERVALARPLVVTRRGGDYAFSGLDLRLGKGRLSGSGGLRGEALALQLDGSGLALAPLARVAGRAGTSGTLAFAVRLDGTRGAPRGRFRVDGRAIRVLAPSGPQLSRLSFGLAGAWNGREVALDGKIEARNHQALSVSGALPLVLRSAPFGLAVPPQGGLALRLRGTGELANLVPLLPLDEDRLNGRFTLDFGLGGTPVAPAASGQLTISGGRYVNFATGMTLQDLRAQIVADGDRLRVRALSADDGKGGTVTAGGTVALAAPGGPAADLSATLADFRITARDEAVAGASGTIAVTGPLASPKITARLAVKEADIALPASLPPEVTTINVVTIDSKTGRGPPPVPQPTTPTLSAQLDLDIDLPGHVFVRGHGIDSEWHGHLTITGTSTAPRLRGSLTATRGTVQFLGKTFRITRGKIDFAGGAKIDPALDIVAEIAANDITAQVQVTGSAAAPRISLTSTPVLPQDEILARVLFNGSLSQISVGEGVEVAQTAAALASGRPGLLDRLRQGVGLDLLSFGSAPRGIASSNLNPAISGTAATGGLAGTAISGGKYVAPGVFVGASEGLTPQSSQVTVQVTVRPHVTVETDLGATGGSGLGANYTYDY
jgi:translocation and assembly module TamB